MKTGSTSVALYNLSSSATRDDLSLIAVIMKAPTSAIRFSNAQKLLDYGFNNFQYKKLASKGDTLKSVSVNKGIETTVNGILENDSGVLIQKGQDKNIQQVMELPEILQAPITQGQAIGSITYTLDGKEIGKVNIVAEKTIEKNSAFNMLESIYSKWFSLLRT